MYEINVNQYNSKINNYKFFFNIFIFLNINNKLIFSLQLKLNL